MTLYVVERCFGQEFRFYLKLPLGFYLWHLFAQSVSMEIPTKTRKKAPSLNVKSFYLNQEMSRIDLGYLDVFSAVLLARM